MHRSGGIQDDAADYELPKFKVTIFLTQVFFLSFLSKFHFHAFERRRSSNDPKSELYLVTGGSKKLLTPFFHSFQYQLSFFFVCDSWKKIIFFCVFRWFYWSSSCRLSFESRLSCKNRIINLLQLLCIFEVRVLDIVQSHPDERLESFYVGDVRNLSDVLQVLFFFTCWRSFQANVL